MRHFESIELLGDVFSWKRLIEDVRIVRISPRSFRAGESAGFAMGLTMGILLSAVTVFISICYVYS